jgi:hypothetical protein
MTSSAAQAVPYPTITYGEKNHRYLVVYRLSGVIVGTLVDFRGDILKQSIRISKPAIDVKYPDADFLLHAPTSLHVWEIEPFEDY